eukprot:9876-Heterococcus_DN1.PRE.1
MHCITELLQGYCDAAEQQSKAAEVYDSSNDLALCNDLSDVDVQVQSTQEVRFIYNDSGYATGVSSVRLTPLLAHQLLLLLLLLLCALTTAHTIQYVNPYMYTSTTLLQPYLGADNPKSACYGLTTSLYVPNGSDLQLGPFAPKLAPMQAPYVVQKTLEQGLRFPFSAYDYAIKWLFKSRAACHNSVCCCPHCALARTAVVPVYYCTARATVLSLRALT